MKEQQDNPLHIIAHGLAAAFGDQPEKITYWLFTNNLNFGGAYPADLMRKGFEKKIVEFILAAQELGAPGFSNLTREEICPQHSIEKYRCGCNGKAFNKEAEK